MRLARPLVAVGTVAFLFLCIVLVTGGFTLRAGPVYLASHNWRGPLAIALVSLATAAWVDRNAFLNALSSTWTFVDQRGPVLAVVLAAASAGIGLGYGTYAASSSDASGYVSEARLLAAGRLATDEPLARQVAWPGGTWAFVPLGYRPGPNVGELVPTYPSGLPLSLASARLAGGELAAYIVVPLLGALAVLCTYAIGASLHSRPAGVVAAALLGTSPIFLFQIVQPMSDVAVTAWWALAFVFALSHVPGSPLAAGAVAGLAVLTRPNLVPLTVAVALALVEWPHTAGTRRRNAGALVAFAAGMTPALGALLLVQWRLYGSPIGSGYGPSSDLFAVENIVPNSWAYANRIMQGEGPAVGLAAFSLVLLMAWRFTRDDAVLLSKRFSVLLATMVALVAASYLPYGVFTEWSYLRFLLPAFPLVFAAVGGLLVAAALRFPAPIRGVVLLSLVTVACSSNVLVAEREQAFNLRRYESRYRLAGLYLRAALPSNAAIVAVQQSGSARYYTGAPIIRWDLMGVDLETALADLRAIGRHPFLLVEDWEIPDLRTRFPASDAARLDWSPRAEFGDETRVRLFDPWDRGVVATWTVDRVH